MQCKTCGADVVRQGVWTEFARRNGCDPRYLLTHAAASARFCRYARVKGKACANPCTAYDPRETFEARIAALDQAYQHPEIQECLAKVPHQH